MACSNKEQFRAEVRPYPRKLEIVSHHMLDADVVAVGVRAVTIIDDGLIKLIDVRFRGSTTQERRHRSVPLHRKGNGLALVLSSGFAHSGGASRAARPVFFRRSVTVDAVILSSSVRRESGHPA
jgi:hypothetical protein